MQPGNDHRSLTGNYTLASGVKNRAAADKAIDALATLHNNSDFLLKKSAIEAVEDNRPAFWTTATYHNQIACIFALTANNSLDLVGALAMVKATDGTGPRSREWLLSGLIPLNPEGRKEIEAVRGLV